MSDFGKDVIKFLVQTWARAPLIIWLGFFLILIAIVVAVILIRVGKIHIGWKSEKRELTFDTDNRSYVPRRRPESLIESTAIPSNTIDTSRSISQFESLPPGGQI